METSLTGEKRNATRVAQHVEPSAVRTETAESDIAETAKDAGTLMRAIVGSLSFDPDEIERDLKKKAHHRSAPQEREMDIRLVIVAVFLVFLVFALDLVFLKM